VASIDLQRRHPTGDSLAWLLDPEIFDEITQRVVFRDGEFQRPGPREEELYRSRTDGVAKVHLSLHSEWRRFP